MQKKIHRGDSSMEILHIFFVVCFIPQVALYIRKDTCETGMAEIHALENSGINPMGDTCLESPVQSMAAAGLGRLETKSREFCFEDYLLPPGLPD